MNNDLSLFLEVLLGAVTLAGSALGLVKWVGSRIEARIAKVEKERKESEDAMRAQSERAEARCREENASATSRIRELEKRSHDEGRQDREHLFRICEQSTRALERIAERLPDTTPPKGNQL